MFTYFYVKEACNDSDIGPDFVYGIELCCEREGELIRLNYISGVFADEKTAESFVELCNRLQLSPVHFYDAVEDAVSF